MSGARFQRVTPPTPGSALAAWQLDGDVTAVLRSLGVGDVAAGAVAVRTIAQADELVVSRTSASSALLTGHGGRASSDAVESALCAAGCVRASLDAERLFPEARDEIEAMALKASVGVQSPRALPVLFDQSRRWREVLADGGDVSRARCEAWAHAHADRCAPSTLGHLLRVPLVVVVGRPNIGKSSLVNAMSRALVSITGNEPGTTRDAVLARVVCDGLVVDVADTPGLAGDGGAGEREPASAIDAHAQRLASKLVAKADLVLDAADACDSRSPQGWSACASSASDPRTLAIALRCDLAPAPPGRLATSSVAGTGLEQLAHAVRSRLVSDEALQHPGPWPFWRV